MTGNRRGEAVYLGHSEAHVESNRVLQNDTASGVYLLYGSGNGVTLVNNWVAGSETYNVYIGSSASPPTDRHPDAQYHSRGRRDIRRVFGQL